MQKRVLILIGAIVLAAIIFGGVFLWMQKPKTPRVNVQNSNIEAADWEKYKDFYGLFEIKYPKDWQAEENIMSPKFSLIFCPKIQSGCAGKVANEKNINEDGPIWLFTYPAGEMEINPSNPAYHYLGTSNNGFEYYLYNEFPKNKAIFNSIISTFKFTDSQNQTADWKTYTNDKYGFEFKYPSICKTSSDGIGIAEGGVQLSVDINSANDNCNFSVVYYDNLDAISIGVNPPRKSVYDFAKDPSLSSTQEIIFHGNNALTGVFENKYISLKEKEIYVSHNGHLYEISYTLVNGKQIFKTDTPEKILSTFKFTQ